MTNTNLIEVINLFNKFEEDIKNWIDEVNLWREDGEVETERFIKLDEERKTFPERKKLLKIELAKLTVKELKELYKARIFNINGRKSEIVEEVANRSYGSVTFIAIIYFT